MAAIFFCCFPVLMNMTKYHKQFLVSVAASVAAFYLIEWLKQRGKQNAINQ